MSWCENYVVHCCLQSELSEFIFRVAGSRYLDWLTQCFSNVSCSWSLFDLHSSVWPPTPPPHPPIHRLCCLWKEVIISPILVLWLEYIFISFIYNILLFWNILLMYNTLFTCTNNNLLLTISLISSMFLRPNEQCKLLNVQLQCGQWQATQRQGGYVLLTGIKSNNWNQIQPDKAWEKQ